MSLRPPGSSSSAARLGMTAAAVWILAVGVFLLGIAAGSPPVLEPQVADSASVLLEPRPEPNRGDGSGLLCVQCCASASFISRNCGFIYICDDLMVVVAAVLKFSQTGHAADRFDLFYCIYLFIFLKLCHYSSNFTFFVCCHFVIRERGG